MNRSITNVIRWAMDELVPPVIRDSKAFMWPFYCLAYKTMRPARYMSFKSDVWGMGENEYADFYKNLNSVSRNRDTDNNSACINRIVADCASSRSILDVGCGKGYLLEEIRCHAPDTELTGVDLLDSVPSDSFRYVQAPANQLPFADSSFDTVVCTHVLEHVTEPQAVLNELLRVARGKVVLVTPKQRPFYYTLDEHINFFFYREQLLRLAQGKNACAENLSGDWYMVVRK